VIRVKLLPTLLCFAACSSGSATSTPGPGETHGSDSKMTPTHASNFEHGTLDPRWQRAEAALERDLASWNKDGEFSRVVAKPLTAPDGTQLEFVFAFESYKGGELAHHEAIVVHDDHVVESRKATAEQLAAFLRANGFPAKHVHAGLLLVALGEFGVLDVGFLSPRPVIDDWAALDQQITSKHKHLDLAYDATGATLQVYKRSGVYVPYGADEADRATVRFDASAHPTVTYDREQRDGTWVTLPKAP